MSDRTLVDQALRKARCKDERIQSRIRGLCNAYVNSSALAKMKRSKNDPVDWKKQTEELHSMLAGYVHHNKMPPGF